MALPPDSYRRPGLSLLAPPGKVVCYACAVSCWVHSGSSNRPLNP